MLCLFLGWGKYITVLLSYNYRTIFSTGRRRYYYWNTETDLVSWLPPGHTRCQVSRPAATLRREMAAEMAARKDKEEEEDGDEEMGIDGDDHMSDKSEVSHLQGFSCSIAFERGI